MPGSRSARLFGQLRGKNMKSGCSIECFDGPRFFGTDFSDFVPSLILAPRNNLATDERRLRKLAVRPNTFIRCDDGQFFDECPFAAEAISELTFYKTRKMVVHPSCDLSADVPLLFHCT